MGCCYWKCSITMDHHTDKVDDQPDHQDKVSPQNNNKPKDSSLVKKSHEVKPPKRHLRPNKKISRSFQPRPLTPVMIHRHQTPNRTMTTMPRLRLWHVQRRC